VAGGLSLYRLHTKRAPAHTRQPPGAEPRPAFALTPTETTPDVARKCWSKFTDTWWKRTGSENADETYELAGYGLIKRKLFNHMPVSIQYTQDGTAWHLDLRMLGLVNVSEDWTIGAPMRTVEKAGHVVSQQWHAASGVFSSRGSLSFRLIQF